MHTFCHVAQRHVQASAWLLALALLLSAGWGQAHRVLHAGLQTQTQAHAQTHAQASPSGSPAAHVPAKAAVSTAGLADEEGSSLCQLLDQLALGAGAAQAQAPGGQAVSAVRLVRGPGVPVILAVAERGFDARGPPAFT